MPNAFTEHGVLMLSSVLNSPQSIQVNIQIMRMFYSTYEKLSPMVAEIGSSHNMLIIKKCKGELERDFPGIYDLSQSYEADVLWIPSNADIAPLLLAIEG